MTREILKQMMPFFLLLAMLWLVAELLENTFSDRNVIAPPPTPAAAAPETP